MYGRQSISFSINKNTYDGERERKKYNKRRSALKKKCQKQKWALNFKA